MAVSVYGKLCSIQTQIDEYEKQIIFSSIDRKYDILREVYSYYKHAAVELEKTGANLEVLTPISHHIHMMTEFFPNERLIETKAFDPNDEKLVDCYSSIEEILDALVYEERMRLLENAQKIGIHSLESLNLENECRLSALAINKMAKSVGLNAKIKIIEPGYLYESPLYCGGGKHVVNLLYYRGKVYLIDVTYSQYFYRKRCVLDKIGAPYISNPNPGAFMVMNPSRRATAERILNDGWIELSMEDFKNYFDGFTMFYRNGSYYEKTGDFSYEPEYSFLDYSRFLGGADNQMLHEGYECLGYQTRALKNPDMSFERR